MSFHSRQSLSVSFFHVSLSLPAPGLPSICISHAVLIAPLERSTCPNQRSLLSLKMRSRFSSSSFASNSLDLTLATSSGLILQICLIMALSLRCKRCRFFLVSGQVWLAGQFLPGCFHTCSDRYFTASTSRKHVDQVAEGSYHLQSDLDFILWPAINRASISHALCTPIIRIWCQSLYSPLHFLSTQNLQPLQ